MSQNLVPQHNPAYILNEQQNQRHQMAYMQQIIYDLERHIATVHDRLVYLGRGLSTPEQHLEFAQLMMQMNQAIPHLQSYREALAAMIQMAPMNYGRAAIPDQCRREIYHLYHSGRYTQDQLSAQYGCGQSAISKIVNGPAPGPIVGVNPQGIAG